MEPKNTAHSMDSDISDSWTILEKSNEFGGSSVFEEDDISENQESETKSEENQNLSSNPASVDDGSPIESLCALQHEGTESVDSDGISIISESEEEELKLLPCNSPVVEFRPCSRSSNKYFEETDTVSQCSTGVHEVTLSQKEKKYKHQPNKNVNSLLNVLLIISWAAVVGLGMGHFLGLQEECSSGYNLDDKVKNESQNEELSVLMLKKLELENIALKEQFAHLQKMIEELHRENGQANCKEQHVQNVITNSEVIDNVVHIDGSKCQLNPIDKSFISYEKESKLTDDLNSKDIGQSDGVTKTIIKSSDEVISVSNGKDEYPSVGYVQESQRENLDGTVKMNAEGETVINKSEILKRLEKSLEDVAVLFDDKFHSKKILFENSKEALSGTISLLSGLLETLKEKFNGIKSSLEGDLMLDKPMKTISKMEEILQKTSEKVQKITESAIKEGKSFFEIPNQFTSKLQAINKKLEEKWCQVKRNLSKQSLVLSWLDNQIFQNCAGDDKLKRKVDGEENPSSSDMFTEKFGSSKGKTIVDDSINGKDFRSTKAHKRTNEFKYDLDYKSKMNGYRNDDNFAHSKTKYKNERDNFIDPNSFDVVVEKGINKVDIKTDMKKEKAPASTKRKQNPKRRYYQNFEMEDRKTNSNHDKELASNKSGEWVEALFNHRAERRRDESKSEWLFERARSRSRTREKQNHHSRWYMRRGEFHTKI